MRPNRKAKRRKGSKGSTKAAPVTTASPEHLTTEETSGLLAFGQPRRGQGSLSGCDTKCPGEGDDHQQGSTPPVQPPLEDGHSGVSSYVGGASTTETNQATAVQAAGESEAVAGTEGVSLARLSAPPLKQEEKGDGGASEEDGLEPASAARSDHRHHEEVRRGASMKGNSNGGLDSGGRTEPREDEATSEKFIGSNVAGTTAAALTVSSQAD